MYGRKIHIGMAIGLLALVAGGAQAAQERFVSGGRAASGTLELRSEATVFGPFFVDGAPRIDLGGDIGGAAPGEPCWVEGTVRDASGAPIPDARIDVWEADADGFYDVQYDDGRTAGRAHLFTGPDGAYRFWAVTPTPYPIPDDGPVGAMLAAVGRSPMRASHLHFRVSAPGHRTLVTHIFVRGDALPCVGEEARTRSGQL